jgi:PhoD-like phosphatase
VSELLLGPMLRHVTPTTATVWVEVAAPATVTVLGRSARTFTVAGHHYALVVLRDLEPGRTIPYEVHLDGRRCWPEEGSTLPPSVIRTSVDRHPVRILFGSCRAAAPHEPPYSLERDRDPDARGVDALWAHARRMLTMPVEEWPDLAVFIGDQIYADDSSPRAAERIEQRRAQRPEDDLPPDEVVADFEEYTWLYREAWSGALERWFFSVVPSAMVFDDHDMIDDWNISESWVQDIRREPWWQEHIIGGLVSYWVHQHLGNLSPDEIDDEGMLAAAVESEDATDLLRRWAFASEEFTPVPGGYRFSHSRDVGGVRLVVIDCRNGRVLDPQGRRMVDEDEWSWVTEHALRPCDHLLIGTSLPVFVPPGVHGLQQWNEALCAGAWGRRIARRSEALRREIDLEDWSAFETSFDEMVDLLHHVTSPPEGGTPPATTTIISGDIHFAYVAGVHLDRRSEGPSPVRQVVSSPMRNALVTVERGAIRFVSGRVGSMLGRVLARLAGRPAPRHRFHLEDGPFFNNNIGLLEFASDRTGRVIVERSRSEDDEPVLEAVIDRTL